MFHMFAICCLSCRHIICCKNINTYHTLIYIIYDMYTVIKGSLGIKLPTILRVAAEDLSRDVIAEM